jgi:hypothetical protein
MAIRRLQRRPLADMGRLVQDTVAQSSRQGSVATVMCASQGSRLPAPRPWRGQYMRHRLVVSSPLHDCNHEQRTFLQCRGVLQARLAMPTYLPTYQYDARAGGVVEEECCFDVKMPSQRLVQQQPRPPLIRAGRRPSTRCWPATKITSVPARRASCICPLLLWRIH